MHLAEVSLLSGKRDEQAERILEIFFQRITQEDQFFCRALLAQASIEVRNLSSLFLMHISVTAAFDENLNLQFQ